MYPQLAALPAYLLAIGLDQPVIGDGAQHHILRETGGSAQSHREAPFAIEGDQQGNLGRLLQPIGHKGLCLGVPFMKQHAANLHLVDITHQQLHVAGVGFRIGDDHKQLANALLQTHRVEHRVYPLLHLCLIDRPQQIRRSLSYAISPHQAG